MVSVVVRAPAKVNLQLSVGPVRPDGYHDLVTVFHALSLEDTITASEHSGLHLTMSGEGAESLPLDDRNLAYRAAMLLAEDAGLEPDVAVHIDKSIPIAGGMAGGSADAAGTLVACDALWRTGYTRDQLSHLAAKLGSDVPFALHGGNAIGRGRGEEITPILGRGQFHWVLALADGGLSTPQVYARCDELRGDAPVPEADISQPLVQALRSGDAEQLSGALHNDLQDAALSLRPALRGLLESGIEFGALAALVSGSGPTCAFLVRDGEHALDVAVALTATGACRTVKRASGPVLGAHVIAS
ncbi:MAG TPA: 4-(cytidine 5'-diphospho)-2-C-methyl-D-erythritol kinase [Candidatus Nanopelagicales bacterium]|nr:4-(cytidine 5'-diphospho)-2-C-methyl-D-erythritol kinase [Candidatus Nanopelagicales bacterium]